MAKFGEDIKTIMLGVERFLLVTLKNVSMPTDAVVTREKLLAEIEDLREEWPQLQPDAEDRRKLEKDAEPASDADKGGSLRRDGSEGNLLEDGKVPDIGVADLTDPVKAGVLVKKSKEKSVKDIFKKKKCFYVLHSATLYGFDKNTSKKANWSRSLENHSAKKVSDAAAKKDFLFELHCPGKKALLFSASTSEEMEEWVAAINKEAGAEMPTGSDEEYYESDVLGQDKDLIDEDFYEDTEAVSVNRPKPTPTLPQRPAVAAAVVPGEDDELYDDMAPPPAPEEDGELYEDGFSVMAPSADLPPPPVPVKTASPADKDSVNSDEIYDDGFTGADDDDIYEAYDDMALSGSGGRPQIEEAPKLPSPRSGPVPVVPPPRALPTPTPSLPPRSNPTGSPKPTRSDDAKSHAMGDNYYENLYYGVWECKAAADTELDFSRGDIMEVVSKKYGEKGWWVAKLNDKIGVVPYSYLSPAYKAI